MVQTDNGAEFKNDAVRAKVQEYGGTLIHGRPYRPQVQGGQERAGGTIKKYIRMALEKLKGNWVQHLPLVLEKYRFSLHQTLKDTPAKVWNDAWAKIWSSEDQQDRAQSMANAVAVVRSVQVNQQIAGKTNVERHKKKYTGKRKKVLKEGTKVLVRYNSARKGELKWRFKAEITKIIQTDRTFEIKWLENAWRGQKCDQIATRYFGSDELKPYHSLEIVSPKDDVPTQTEQQMQHTNDDLTGRSKTVIRKRKNSSGEPKAKKQK